VGAHSLFHRPQPHRLLHGTHSGIVELGGESLEALGIMGAALRAARRVAVSISICLFRWLQQQLVARLHLSGMEGRSNCFAVGRRVAVSAGRRRRRERPATAAAGRTAAGGPDRRVRPGAHGPAHVHRGGLESGGEGLEARGVAGAPAHSARGAARRLDEQQPVSGLHACCVEGRSDNLAAQRCA